MKLLFLAPQPFFQERGTPIAVRLALEVLTERFKISGAENGKIDLLTYHEGKNLSIPGVTIHRIKGCNFIKNVGPGISFKKLFCDLIFLFTALKIVLKERGNPYDLIHAVEESVFVALLLKFFFGIPYVYDMDSSIALQVTEKWWWLKPLAPIFSLLEKLAVKHSTAVVPVCDALAVIADRHGSKDTHILRDVSLMKLEQNSTDPINLKKEINVRDDNIVIIYVGNLEAYQGVQFLIRSFAKVSASIKNAHLVIIGGSRKHMAEYGQFRKALPSSDRIHLLGPRPVSSLGAYLMQADILASPRIKGNNTPMKIYSYLHSGKAIIATDLPTHSQVMNNEVALLVHPSEEEFGNGLITLVNDPELRSKLGEAAFQLAEENYTFNVFKERLNALYDRLGEKMLTAVARAA